MQKARFAPYAVLIGIIGTSGVGLIVASHAFGPSAAGFVYVAAGDGGLRIVDVTSPTSPHEVGATGPQSTTLAVAAQESYAYTAEDGGGMLVVDVSSPAAPTIVSAIGGNSSDLAVYGDVAYLVDPAGLRVVSVADKADPQEIGFVQAGATSVAVEGVNAYATGALGLTVINVSDPMNPFVVGTLLGRADDVAVAAGRAYLVSPIGGLRIVDVSNSAQPALLGSLALSGDLRAVAVSGAVAYVAAMGVAGGSPGALHIVDVSDPAAPASLGSYGGSFRDVAVEGSVAYLVTDAGAVDVVDVSVPAAPVRFGILAPAWQALRVAIAASVPTIPTLTATVGPTEGPTVTETPTISGTVETATPTDTRAPSATATPTNTRPPSSTPTASVTPTALPTRVPGRSWYRFTTDNAPLPSNEIRFVSTDSESTAWARAVRGGRQPDSVIGASATAPWRLYDDLRAAVTLRARDIRRMGALDDFWALDRSANVWIGAEYFDGQSWHSEGADEWSPDGRMRLLQQVVVDSAGYAWVPYDTDTECRGVSPCRIDGLRAFVAGRRMETDITFYSDPSALQRHIPAVHLLSNHLRPDPTGQGFAFAQRSAYPLPLTYVVAYPVLLDLAVSPRLRSGGYATAATVRPDGRADVFTWVEQHLYDLASRRVFEHRVFVNTWDGTSWSPVVDVSTSPLFPTGVAANWVVASAYGPDGARWTASASGDIAVQGAAGAWIDHFRPSEVGLPAGARINDMAVGADYTVWLATTAGLFAYGNVGTPGATWTLYVPATMK